MRLHLIRHPKPRIGEGICYGQLDPEADNVDAIAQRLRSELPADLPLWTSPLRRCRSLADSLHANAQVDARLAEMHFGRWEGLPWQDIPRHELDAWAADIAGYAPPGGESPSQLQARALDFVRSLAVDEAIIITHAGVIRTLLADAQNLPPARWCELNFAYASHTVWDFRR